MCRAAQRNRPQQAGDSEVPGCRGGRGRGGGKPMQGGRGWGAESTERLLCALTTRVLLTKGKKSLSPPYNELLCLHPGDKPH